MWGFIVFCCAHKYSLYSGVNDKEDLKPSDISGIRSEGFVEKLVNSDGSEFSATVENRDSDFHDQEDIMLTVDRG